MAPSLLKTFPWLHNTIKIQSKKREKKRRNSWWSSGWESSVFTHGAWVPSLSGELGSSSHVARSKRKTKHTQIPYLQDPSDPGSVLGPWIPPCPLPANLWQREHHSHFKRGNWDQRGEVACQRSHGNTSNLKPAPSGVWPAHSCGHRGGRLDPSSGQDTHGPRCWWLFAL